MPSDAGAPDAYVWVWLPGHVEPVVAGALQRAGSRTFEREPVLLFRYGDSYLARPEAMSLFPPELPLGRSVHDPTSPAPGRAPLPLASVLRDAAPDSWGRRVIDRDLAGQTHRDGELRYLLRGGSDRIGALHVGTSPARVEEAPHDGATLDQLLHLAELIEAGEPIPASLEVAAGHGTSVGGARPKALLRDGDRHLIAKFPSSTDSRPVVQAEAVAMMLASRAGLSVAPVEVVRADGRNVLLVERFDRRPSAAGASPARRHMLSMLTIVGASEMGAHRTTYPQLADLIRKGPWTDVADTLRELYTRLVFNVLVGNTDDHLRNHAAFWDGRTLTLTPAYDIAPQVRSTNVADQALGITRDGQRASQLRLCLAAAREFMLTQADAREIVDRTRGAVLDGWDDACDAARLTTARRAELMGREFLNEYIDYDAA